MIIRQPMAEACGSILVGKLTVNGLIENNSAIHRRWDQSASNASEIHFADVTVKNNKATGSGGGIYLTGGVRQGLSGESARILGNTASSGGGIGTRLSQMILSGGVIADNKASNLGGGVYLDGSQTLVYTKGTDHWRCADHQ